ncbi:hypothetical protein [Actinomadura sp. WMMB 499]|uniref:hypothetical protein n=1 Tax=Actinomadura sp. WMMB 499 TaxID=1219491 RepID=UPI0012472DC4|nr:hypothetical protein [Actinomadura sp. WMMB 499]QFG25971.1 hypothetical protein F7P10_37315 [Actinomadura sp. WMMB 499]
MIEARDTGSPGTAPTGGRDRPPEKNAKPGSKGPSPKLLFGAAAALVLVVVAVVAVVLVTGGGEEKAPAVAKVVPTAYTPDYNGGGFAQIADRRTDQRAITEAEAFGGDAKTIQSGRYTFTQAGAQLTDCKSATWGDRLQQDLAAHGCTQIGRAAYVSADKKVVGQFIVINMKDKAGADQIMRSLEPGANAGWIVPLNPDGAPAFGAGFSAAYARNYGHYAVVTWVQEAGGGQGATLNELIDASLAVEKPADFLWARLGLADEAAQ